MLEISVHDTGVGIKLDQQANLFGLFGYIDTKEGMNQRGVGLGLHISRMIVR